VVRKRVERRTWCRKKIICHYLLTYLLTYLRGWALHNLPNSKCLSGKYSISSLILISYPDTQRRLRSDNTKIHHNEETKYTICSSLRILMKFFPSLRLWITRIVTTTLTRASVLLVGATAVLRPTLERRCNFSLQNPPTCPQTWTFCYYIYLY
jgi:hypothetical protein